MATRKDGDRCRKVSASYLRYRDCASINFSCRKLPDAGLGDLPVATTPPVTAASQDNSVAVTANSSHTMNDATGKTNGDVEMSYDTPALEQTAQSSTLADTSAPETQPLPATHLPRSKSPLLPLEGDPAVKQPLSDVRQPTEPVPADVVTEIKETKERQDLAADQGLANGLAQGGDAPIERSLNSDAELPPSERMAPDITTQATEVVDTSNQTAVAETNIDQPIPHYPPSPLTDVSMPDAPAEPQSSPFEDIQPSIEEASPANAANIPTSQQPLSAEKPVAAQPKVSHPRDEEELESEPVSKRIKAVEDTLTEPEFKVPDPPNQASVTPSALVSNSGDGEKYPASPSTASAAPAPAPIVVNGKQILDRPEERKTNPEHNIPMTKPQQKHLQRGLTNMKKSTHAHSFIAPVDYTALNLPNYPDVVKNPMDLRTMEIKLKEDQYQTVADYIRDFDQMVTNTVLFNGDAHDVTQHAFQLRLAFDRNLLALPSKDFTEPTAAEKKAKKAAAPKPPPRRESRSSIGTAKSPTASSPQTTFALGPSGVPLIRRDSAVADGRPKREIHPPAPKDLPYSAAKPKRKKFQMELKFCAEVLTELKRPKHLKVSEPFLQPVDPVSLNIPNYHKLIKKPMDVSTIDKKLAAGQYENAKEFEADVRLMFQNCYKFNPPTHPVHGMGKEYEKVFEDKWSQKAKWLNDHAPSSEAQSPGSFTEADEDEEESDEEPEEEDDDNADQIAKLQESILAISQQIDTLSKGKKKSPPAGAKKTKTSKATMKKEPKKAPAKPSRKNTSKKSSQKVPIMSYDEKRSISDRINDLPENKMPQVLQIIRDNMPGLKVSFVDQLHV